MTTGGVVLEFPDGRPAVTTLGEVNAGWRLRRGDGRWTLPACPAISAACSPNRI